MRVLSFLLQCGGVVLAGVAIWMYVVADASDGTGSLSEKLTAAGIMIVGVVLTLVGKRMNNISQVRNAIDAAKSGNLAAKDVDVVASELQRNAPPPKPVAPAGPSALFRPVLSTGDHQSWIGGEPEMDDGLDWPSTGDTPMSFIAQIHCPDIPADTCGGLLPKEGWLVFFYAGGYEPNARLLHTRSREVRFSTPDIQPEGHLFLAPNNLIDPPRTAPRVPIELVEEHVDAEALFDEERRNKVDEAIGDSIASWRDAFDLTNPAFQPFDATSAQALFAMVHGSLQRSAEIDPEQLAGDRRKMVEARAARKSAFETEFSRELSGKARVGLDPASRADRVSRLKRFQISPDENGLDLANRSRELYTEVLGWIMRTRWFDTPDEVPAESYEAVKATWQKQLDAMTLVVGGRGTERTRSSLRDYRIGVPPEESLCLLMLTTTSFMGWNFGDNADLAFYMTPNALAGQTWDEVVAVDTHGH